MFLCIFYGVVQETLSRTQNRYGEKDVNWQVKAGNPVESNYRKVYHIAAEKPQPKGKLWLYRQRTILVKNLRK